MIIAMMMTMTTTTKMTKTMHLRKAGGKRNRERMIKRLVGGGAGVVAQW